MQYAVQQTATHHSYNAGRAVTHNVCTRLPAFNRAHADDMADALGERNVRREWSVTRHEPPTIYTYEVVAAVHKADNSTVWLSLSELEMIASMYTEPAAILAAE